MSLYRGGQPLAAALVWAELARGGMASAQLWCALGSALMQSRGRLVRRPFELWAGKVFNRGASAIAGTEYAAPVNDWLTELPEARTQPPLVDAELSEMIEFLLVNERVLPDAVGSLGDSDRMGVVMALGDRGDPLYVPLLRCAIEGQFGGGAARAAAKRVGPFLGRADLQASIEAARTSPIAEELGPYLQAVLSRLPEGWDAPRTRACPPYLGIGRIDVALVSAGPRPADIAGLLRAQLGASARDAESWVRFAPCVLKKGAMRHDALQLQSALEPMGAKLELHGFTWGHESSPSEVRPASTKKPWWKFW
ncbi:MAG: hypothetical protein H0T76_08585 [Nannocystis sp.]|nr:hypothetical protein [Nannocystis sp.]MBA3546524.1 hypothetical protein [Nannocystis sp.]